MAKARPATKSEMIHRIANGTGLSRKAVAAVFDELTAFIKHQLGKKGPGIVNVTNLVKLKRVERAATSARAGRNPFTGEIITIAAKPKRTVVKALPLRGLKEMVTNVRMSSGLEGDSVIEAPPPKKKPEQK